MDYLLRFKASDDALAFKYTFALQLKKRFKMALAAVVILTICFAVSYPLGTETLSLQALILRVAKILLLCVFCFGIYCMIRKSQKFHSYANVINVILDIIVIVATFSFYPIFLVGGGSPFGGLGNVMLGWMMSSVFISALTTVGNWYLRIISVFVQMFYFCGFIIKQENYKGMLIVYGVETFVFYAAMAYIYEMYERIHFLEKRKMVKDAEAVKKILNDIAEGIVIIDKKTHKVLYCNQPVKKNFGINQNASLTIDPIFSQILVRSSSNFNKPNNSHSESESLIRLADFFEDITQQLYGDSTNSCSSRPLKTYEDNYLLTKKKENSVCIEGISKDLQSNVTRNYLVKFTTSLYSEVEVIVANINDTTDRDALITLKDHSNYKTRLLASVSHELRTPLNGSINFTEQALSDSSVPQKIKDKLLLPALRSNRLLLSLIDDILDSSQIQAGKLRLVFERKNALETARECTELLELQASKKGVEIQFESQISPANEMLTTDHNRLRQIILNLLSNAVKFTFAGSIKLTLQESLLFCEMENNYSRGIRVICKDTGIGISEENQQKLFQAFEKIDLCERKTMNSTGVGLGLVISNNLTQRLSISNKGAEPLLKGNERSIQFESKVNEGSCFYFDIFDQDSKNHSLNFVNLTAEKEDTNMIIASENNIEVDQVNSLGFGLNQIICKEHLRTGSTRSKLSIGSRGQTIFKGSDSQAESSVFTPKTCRCPSILIVDDDSFNLTALEMNLSKFDLKCDWAFHGQQALQKLEHRQANRCCSSCRPYSVVFLDCNMPVMDGYEAAKIINNKIKKGELEPLRLIACTAFIQQSELDKAKLAGMDDYCTKPINVSIIREKLTSIGFSLK